jgi:hypothetical protein
MTVTYLICLGARGTGRGLALSRLRMTQHEVAVKGEVQPAVLHSHNDFPRANGHRHRSASSLSIRSVP